MKIDTYPIFTRVLENPVLPPNLFWYLFGLFDGHLRFAVVGLLIPYNFVKMWYFSSV